MKLLVSGEKASEDRLVQTIYQAPDSSAQACSQATLFQALLLALPFKKSVDAIDRAVGECAKNSRRGATLYRAYILGLLEAGAHLTEGAELTEFRKALAGYIGETLFLLLSGDRDQDSAGSHAEFFGRLSNATSGFLKNVNGSIIFETFNEVYAESGHQAYIDGKLRDEKNTDLKILDEVILKRFRAMGRQKQIKLLAG